MSEVFGLTRFEKCELNREPAVTVLVVEMENLQEAAKEILLYAKTLPLGARTAAPHLHNAMAAAERAERARDFAAGRAADRRKAVARAAATSDVKD